MFQGKPVICRLPLSQTLQLDKYQVRVYTICMKKYKYIPSPKVTHPQSQYHQLRLEQLEVGVQLEDSNGYIREIVARWNKMFQLSHKGTLGGRDAVPGKWWTVDELNEQGDRIIYRPKKVKKVV